MSGGAGAATSWKSSTSPTRNWAAWRPAWGKEGSCCAVTARCRITALYGGWAVGNTHRQTASVQSRGLRNAHVRATEEGEEVCRKDWASSGAQPLCPLTTCFSPHNKLRPANVLIPLQTWEAVKLSHRSRFANARLGCFSNWLLQWGFNVDLFDYVVLYASRAWLQSEPVFSDWDQLKMVDCLFLSPSAAVHCLVFVCLFQFSLFNHSNLHLYALWRWH